VDEGISTLQSRDLALVVIDADDSVTHFRETNRGNKANISGTYDGDLQLIIHGRLANSPADSCRVPETVQGAT
jgi:hypothetical protein